MHLVLGYEEALNAWSWDRYEHSDVVFFEHFVKVCLPFTKNKNLSKESSMEHPPLPEFPALANLTGDFDECYSEQTKKLQPTKIKSIVRTRK